MLTLILVLQWGYNRQIGQFAAGSRRKYVMHTLTQTTEHKPKETSCFYCTCSFKWMKKNFLLQHRFKDLRGPQYRGKKTPTENEQKYFLVFLFKMSKYWTLTGIIIRSHNYKVVLIVNNNTVDTFQQKSNLWFDCFSQMQTWILHRLHGATVVSTSVLWSLLRIFQETVKTTQN